MSERNYSFGIELEMADIDRLVSPPVNCKFTSDFDIVNSDGIAIDPSGKVHLIGGEVITPAGTESEVLGYAEDIFNTYPNATFNHRTVLHSHISWPELPMDVDAMKSILSYQREYGMEILNTVWTRDRLAMSTMNRSARAFYTYDFTIMPEYKYNFCMNATSPQEFRLAYAMTKDGKVNWLHAKRYALNMYSIFKHGTIEFRHWFPTKKRSEIASVLDFCRKYIDNALGDRLPFQKLLANNTSWTFPVEDDVKYNHVLEIGWQRTNMHTNTREEATECIEEIWRSRGL